MEKKEISEVLSAITDASQNKKKPGRPKKCAMSSTIQIDGLVEKPSTPGRLIEAVYHNTACLKKIITLYRSYNSEQVYINFTHSSISWFAHDHMEKVDCYADIFANNITKYYCQKPITFSVTRASIELVFNILDKSATDISIILEPNLKSHLIFVIHCNDYGTTERFEVEVSECSPSVIPPKPDTTSYPISLTMATKHFKTRFNNINKFNTEVISFQKDNTNAPFQIVCSKGPVFWSGAYNDPTKIQLTSKLGDNDFFIVSVKVSNLYALSNNALGKEFIITMDKYKKISFVTTLDERDTNNPTTVVSVYISIVNYDVFEAHMQFK